MSQLYYILTNETQQGPYTLGQIRSMWSTGAITPAALYWIEGKDTWESILEIQHLLESVSSPRLVAATPSPQVGVGVSSQQLEVLKLQSRMKSKTIAAVLSIFIPFIGCFYSNAKAALIYGTASLVSTVILLLLSYSATDGQDLEPIGVFAAIGLFFLFYVMSIFSSIKGVEKFNQMLLSNRNMPTKIV